MKDEEIEAYINELSRLMQKAAALDPVDSWARMKLTALEDRIEQKKQGFIDAVKSSVAA